jgi:signal transduction histidine kinase
VGNEIYNSVVSRLAARTPLLAKGIVERALEKIGATPQDVTPTQMRRAIAEQIAPEIHRFLDPAESVETLGAGLVAFDGQGRLTRITASADSMLRALGVDLRAAANPWQTMSAFLGCEADAQPGQVIVREIVAPDGTGPAINVATYRQGDEGDPALATLCILQDVTLRVRLEEEVDRVHERLRDASEHSRRLAQAKEELTQMVIHDLRTPLTSVIAALETVIADLGSGCDNGTVEVATIAAEGARTLSDMVSDLMDIARVESGQLVLARAPLSVPDLARSVVAQLSYIAGQDGIAVTLDFPDDLPLTDGDASRLRRVFINLIGNAIKFSAPGGRVWVTGRSSNGELLISIRDEGEGIAADLLPRVFDKYANVEGRRRDPQSSTGLGLAYCKAAVEAHGGWIGVESEKGVGSTFQFTLPIAAAA